MTEPMIFGKLPSHGDFVSRGLSSSEQAELDRWLSSSIEDARSRLGDRFASAFEAALPWQFAWDDGLWTAGAMAPSVDSAGRRFPLLAGLRGLERSRASAACEQCEEKLFGAVAHCWNADQLAAELAAVVAAPGPGEVEEGWWPKDAREARLPQRLPPDILARMIEAPIGAGG